MTIFGTRPEIIRLSILTKILDQYSEHITVHTGQNYDESLSDIFIRDLEFRTPDVHFGIRANTFGEQAGKILELADEAIATHKPDKVLILGDTNSALAAIAAARRGVPVFHMEAGNRCYDDRVPEEINRRIVDHSSSILLPYTNRGAENLVKEGIPRERIYVTGNPILEVLEHFSSKIDESPILEDQKVKEYGYFLVTLHRAENVDLHDRLIRIVSALNSIAEKFKKPVLIGVHPRTQEKLKTFEIAVDPANIVLLDPLGFFDFIKLEKNALAVLTDSGTVQEECSIFRIPNVTLRDVTERPETIETGSNIISGSEPDSILRCVEFAVSQSAQWSPPTEYLATNVSQIVSRILLGYSSFKRHI
jgi:UDP-N-acetylglucosamine 2-epimerase (non-hydrolysing)